MRQGRALVFDQLNVLVVLERGPMLRLLIRRVAVSCDGDGRLQRLGGVVPKEQTVYLRMDSLRADCASDGRILLGRRAAYRR